MCYKKDLAFLYNTWCEFDSSVLVVDFSSSRKELNKGHLKYFYVLLDFHFCCIA